MKFVNPTLGLLTIGMLCCSFALARPLRGTHTEGPLVGRGIDAQGNPAQNSPNSVATFKSGVIINRIRQTNLLNLSGKRQVFRNFRSEAFDPEEDNFTQPATRERFVFPKGRARKENLVTGRFLTVHNPRKAPPEEVRR